MLDFILFKSRKDAPPLYFLYFGSGLDHAGKWTCVSIFAKSQTKLKMPSFPQWGHELGFSRGKYFFLIQNLIANVLMGVGAIKHNLLAGEIVQKSHLTALQLFIRDQSKAIIHSLVINLK